jgi:hypothetical protein
MKKQLLALCAIMAIVSNLNAAQTQKSFDFNEYGFNVPTVGLKHGDTFTITNINIGTNPKEIKAKSRHLKDASGKVWARKINARDEYSATAGGETFATFTYKVR